MSVEYSKTASPGYPKSVLTQFTRGVNLVFSFVLPFIASFEYIRRHQQITDSKEDTFILILNSISYAYILIAITNYVIYGRPVFGSYFLVVASFLTGLTSSIALIRILKNIKKVVNIYVLIVLFTISFIGVIIDPYVYRTPSHSWYLDFMNQARVRVLGKVLISSLVNEVQIISSEQSSCIPGINTYLGFIMHYYYSISIKLNELKCYFIVTNSVFTNVVYNDGAFYLVLMVAHI